MAQAMDVGDIVMESTLPSLIVESIQQGEELSPEDNAWVDSCLINESDTLDENWSSLKSALLEILDSQPESLSTSAHVTDASPSETNIEIFPSSEGAETESIQRRTHNNLLPVNEEAERKYDDDDDMSTNDDTNGLHPSTVTGNPFLPGYNDDQRPTVNPELEANVGYSELEPSTEDIFTVWDLEVPVEEDDLVKQLNKALEESLPIPAPSTFDDSDVWEQLIAGIADLSLDQNSS